MKKLIKLLKPHKIIVLVLVILLLGQAICELYLPVYMADMINVIADMINVISRESAAMKILQVSLLMIGVTAIAGVIAITISYITSRLATNISKNLREKMFAKVIELSNDEIEGFSTASLITRCTNDVNQVQTVMQFGLRMALYSPMMAVGGIVMAIYTMPSMTWLVGLTCILVLLVMVVMFKILLPKFKILQKLTDKINLVARQHLTGIMVIRSFGTEKHEKDNFKEANDEFTDTQLFTSRVMSYMMPIMMLLINLGSLFIIWISTGKIATWDMQIGQMFAFMQFALMIVMSFMFMAMMFMFVPRAAVAADRIHEVLDSENKISEINKTVKPKTFSVKFDNVSYRYFDAEEDVIKNVSFEANPGKTTAIIGATGSGKTTLVNLLMRFYDVASGKITIGDVDIRKMAIAELRKDIGYIPQKGMLFSGTIKSNLLYGRDNASIDEITKAADVAQALKFINEKDKKFDDEISQSGGNVSGGQKQRLSIARALVKNSPIYVFDDSFSALDFKTDVALRKALKNNLKQAVIIIVAQRISTIKDADEIIVMDEGKVVAKGTHDELLKRCQIYKEIAISQNAIKE